MCKVSIECNALLNLMMAAHKAEDDPCLAGEEREILHYSVLTAHWVLLNAETVPRFDTVNSDGTRTSHFTGHR